MHDLSSASFSITGGAGSFGRKLCEVLLKEYSPRKITVFSRDELKHHDMRTDGFDAPCMEYCLGDIRDRERLTQCMKGADFVIHAAALKHVVSCENNPSEAVRTNIDGAQNVADVAAHSGVQCVLAISTDKAVNAGNVYGATKLAAEKIFIQSNDAASTEGTRFSCARYGNFIASRGSVIPLFIKQRATGTVTLTDERMTRFWMTTEASVRFALESLRVMSGGEIFVPRSPSMTMGDLADAIAPGCKHRIIGVQPGEKLHETLISDDEVRRTVSTERGFVILPENLPLTSYRWPEPNVPGDFRYVSNTNDQWLSKEDLAAILGLPVSAGTRKEVSVRSG